MPNLAALVTGVTTRGPSCYWEIIAPKDIVAKLLVDDVEKLLVDVSAAPGSDVSSGFDPTRPLLRHLEPLVRI